MDYRKPSKSKANEGYLMSSGYEKDKPYAEEHIDVNKTFLIVCEGENTEPGYFKAFPVPTNVVMIKGGCNSRTALVDYTLELKNDPEYAGREIWCVFDYDIHPDQAATQPNDFNTAIDKAEQNGMKCAWSNDAFELWFLLHYDKIDTPLSRHQIYPILKNKWSLGSFQKEAKTREFCAGHYDRHGGTKSESQKLAIRRAKALHEARNGARDFANHCPVQQFTSW